MEYFPLFAGKDDKFANIQALPFVKTLVNGEITEQKKINPLKKQKAKKVMMFLKRDFDVQNAVIELLNWTDAIILLNATEGDTEDYDVEDAGLRHTTNISICNVLSWILKLMNV